MEILLLRKEGFPFLDTEAAHKQFFAQERRAPIMSAAANQFNATSIALKNRALFWTLIEEDIARILIEIHSGAPLTSSYWIQSLHYGSDDVQQLVRSFAYDSFSWLELNTVYTELIDKEKEAMQPIWRDYQSNPREQDDPLPNYKSGSALVEASMTILLPFIEQYVQRISPLLVKILRKWKGVARNAMYRRIYKRIRFMYCEYFQVTVDVVRKRGPIVHYTLPTTERAKVVFKITGLVEKFEVAFMVMPYFYAELHWLPSIPFWTLFKAYEGIEIPYSLLLRKFVVPHCFAKESSPFVTFAKQSGSVIWLSEGCEHHANTTFMDQPHDPHTWLISKKENFDEALSRASNSVLASNGTIKLYDELLLPSRHYGPTLISEDGVETSNFENNLAWNTLDLDLRIDFGRVSKWTVMIDYEYSKMTEHSPSIKHIFWGYMKFEGQFTQSDGDCFYESLLLAMNIRPEFFEVIGLKKSNNRDWTGNQFKSACMANLKNYFLGLDDVQKWFLMQLCSIGENEDNPDVMRVIEKYEKDGEWGGLTVALLLSVLLGTNIVLIRGSTGTFRMTSRIIYDFVTGKRSLSSLSSNDKETLITDVLPYCILDEKTSVFLLHCNSVNPLVVGRSCFEKVFRAKTLEDLKSPVVLNHYIPLTLSNEMKDFDTMEILNHLYLLQELVDCSTISWDHNAPIPSQNCVPGFCTLYTS